MVRGRLGPVGIEAAAQSEEMMVVIEIDDPEDLDDARLEPSRIGYSGLPVVDPVGSDIELTVPRLTGFLDRPGAWLFVLVVRRPVRPVAQAEQEIVSYTRRKQAGRRADIADATAGNRERNGVDIGFADHQAPARRSDEPGEELGHKVSAAAALADDGHIRAEGKLEIDPLEQMDPVTVHQIEIGGGDLAAQRFDGLRLFEQQSFIEHIRDMELLDDLLILDRDVLLILIEIEQFLPRR